MISEIAYTVSKDAIIGLTKQLLMPFHNMILKSIVSILNLLTRVI